MDSLPVELKEHVYNSLVVSDRARFCMAMKKTTDNRFMHKCPKKERRLGLFVRSIKRRMVTTPSLPMLQFLGTIDRDDPTLDEIAEVFPEAVAKHRNSQEPQVMSMVDRIRDGSLTEEDVRARLHENLSAELKNDWFTSYALNHCTPQQLDILLIHPDIRAYIDHFMFLYNIFTYANEELIVYMKDNHTRLGINMTAHERSVVVYITEKASRVIFMCPEFIPIAIRHLPFTPEDLDLISSKCIEEMNMDVVEAIDRFRGM